MTAQVAADLRAAAEVLRRDGWTQGALTDMDGCHCASGAILAATEDTEDGGWFAAARAFIQYLGIPHSIPAWNDTPGRTADEVIAALEAAADAAEASDV